MTRQRPTASRKIMTVLFTDIVDSTAQAAEIGDRAWQRLLDRHDQLVRAELAKFDGREIDTAGDGFLATFESPGSAITCSTAILAGARKLGLSLRAGLHTGECTDRGDDIVGLAVHIAARIEAVAEPGEVWVSSTVKDLTAGGDFTFSERGTYTLKGVPGTSSLFAASLRSGSARSSARASLAGRRPPPIDRDGQASVDDVRSDTGTEKPLVLVVDDHPVWRQTIAALLDRSGTAREVLEASDGLEAVERARARRPDIVLMDMSIPGMHGIEATAQITGACPDSRVLVLSSSDDENQVIEAVQAGATGYLLKTSRPPEILDGVRRVHAGELVFPPSLAKLVVDGLRGGRRATGPLAALTEREVEVLALMAEGHTNDTIGKTLHLSAKTVETHVTSIFSKLGLDPGAGGHRRVLAVVAYLNSVRSRRRT